MRDEKKTEENTIEDEKKGVLEGEESHKKSKKGNRNKRRKKMREKKQGCEVLRKRN